VRGDMGKKYTKTEVDEHLETLRSILRSNKNTAFNPADMMRIIRKAKDIILQLNRPRRDYG